MFNRMMAQFHRPEHGWDPVPPDHAAQYAREAWETGARRVKLDVIDELDERIGGFEGKRVLDLGGGPGHYSVAFARRGAHVTWHDVSKRYREVVSQRAAENGVEIQLSLGYMDEAPRILKEQFDLVFNRICWCYCWSDRSFARAIFSLLKPGGYGFIDTEHSGREVMISKRMRAWPNDTLAVKVGNPHPPHGRIARLISDFAIESMLVDYSRPTSDVVLFRRALQ